MASKNFTGYLRDPLGEFSSKDKLLFVHVSTTGETISGSASTFNVDATGLYNIDIEYGNVSISSRDANTRKWQRHGVFTINSDTSATTLPALLNASVPVSDPVLVELESLLADAEAAANRAELLSRIPSQQFKFGQPNVYAGGGFSEWGTGNGFSYGGLLELSEATNNANQISIGTDGSDDNYSELYLSGCKIRLHTVARAIDGLLQHGRAFTKFPTAPDGLDKADGTGRFASLAEAITAGGTSLSASVIHRQDLWGVEVFDVNITTSGLPLYPYGNCQYGGSWSGITLADNLVAQGYSALHVGDTTTKGKGFLPDLTNDNHVKFIQDKNNNCNSNHLGEVIQRQYRIRTIAGLEGAWSNLDPQSTSKLQFSNTMYVEPQGIDTAPTAFTGDNNANNYQSYGEIGGEIGVFRNTSSQYSYSGNCWFINIGLVQRRNQGAYHQVYNLAGTKGYGTSSDSGLNRGWWEPDSLSATNLAETFSNASTSGSSPGAIAGTSSRNTRPDDYYYDAIYASDVLDLRMSAHYVDYDQVNRVENAKSINATARGWEAQPFTFVDLASTFTANGAATTVPVNDTSKWKVGDIVTVVNRSNGEIILKQVVTSVGSTVVFVPNTYARPSGTFDILGERKIPYYQAEPTWTDIIGDPAVIAATFPNGVSGTWIPVIPDGTIKTFKMTKKAITSYGGLFTTNSGATWGVSGISPVSSANSLVQNFSASTVRLDTYKAKANFLNPANLSKVESQFSPIKSSNYHDSASGCILTQSTIGKIPTATYVNSYLVSYGFTRLPTLSSTTSVLGTSSPTYLGKHDSLTVDLNPANSPALKFYTYITSRNNILYLQVIAKEIVYDAVDGFGDNDVFEHVNGIATKQDENLNEVIYGCWERPLNYWANNKVT